MVKTTSNKPGKIGKRIEGLIRATWPLLWICFRPSLHHVERLPRDRPYLLVANHSAGIGLAELACFAALYVRQIGPTQPIAGFAHPIGFKLWPMSLMMKRLGAIPSTYEAAYEALSQDVALLVFPGGDFDTLKPVWKAKTVDFNQRKGFLKIAQKANVPIIPLGIRGSHYTVPMLLRANWLANILILPRLYGVKRWGLSVLHLIVAGIIVISTLSITTKLIIIWLWLSAPVGFIPIIPWTISMHIGHPITPETLFKTDNLDDALQQVERTIEALVRDEYQDSSMA